MQMEELTQQWGRCLQIIRENIKSKDADWLYNTWLAPVTIGSYDESKDMLVLQVPSSYVYEFLEHYFVRQLSWAIHTVFSPNTKLGYRIVNKTTKQSEGFLDSSVSPTRLTFAIPDARRRMEEELHRVIGDSYQWLPPYDKIASWLSDNKGRGLLFVGTPGIGKSVVCKEVLPAIIGGKNRDKIPVVSAVDMRSRIDELRRARCVVIDDLGKEPRKHYGDVDNTFFQLCDASANGGPLLIINTNLSTSPVPAADRHLYPLSIQERYGAEVLDRLRAMATTAIFTGKSLRT